MELPKTEQELNDLIEGKVNEERERLTAKHNSDMANARKKYDDDIRKAKEQANLTAEELAQQKIKEQQEADQKELAELRSYKKSAEISSRLAKEGLPSYFKNDARLLNAKEEDFDRVLKEVKKEYEGTLPKGNTHSSVVQTNTQQAQMSDKDKANAEMGAVLTSMFGNN